MATKPPAKPAPKAPEKAPAEAAPAPAGTKPVRSKRTLIALVAALVLAAGGAGAWLLLAGGPAPVDAAATPAAEAPKKAEPARPKPDPSRPPLYVALETFTVNLQAESGEHMLQTSFSLKVAEAGVEKQIKQAMPEVRSRLLLLLSSKKPSELASVAGKQALAEQIAGEINQVLGAPPPAKGEAPAEPGPVLSVFFTNFIIQ